MKLGIVGMGYWGPNLVRNFLATNNVESVVCCDVSEKRLHIAKRKFPSVELTTSYDELLSRDDIEAVAIATPVSTHFPLGMKALEAGKHLLLEKPMTGSSEEALQLVEEAEKRELTLMVDHTFIYTGAVRKIKELVDLERIGDILYFDSVRVNLGLFQHDTNVIWDLAPHDLSIMDYLIEKEPVAVTAVGVNHFNGVEDIAYLTVQYADKLIAHFHVNWLSPVKIRKILIGGSKLMVVYDDMEPSEKVKVYDKGVEVRGEESIHKTLVQYRTGDMHAPQIDQTEALSLLTAEFINSILTGTRPISDGRSGLNVVRILEAAEISIRSGGRRIELANNPAFA
jgi:predicted dehydrogenase